uniref:hypothetical protein n=1 Tax=Cellvibrio fontiphilus TaxID=1815559 RepID=UPI002B4BB2E2|nr:hypothetical protein [Cellvibrio fontiphilus]
MNNPLISTFIAGCVITSGLLGSYLIQRKQFVLQYWFNTALLSFGIGAISTLLLCTGLPVFSTSIAVALGVIIYFAPQAKHDEKLEQVLTSIAGGIVIGLVSMVGFVMCC